MGSSGQRPLVVIIVGIIIMGVGVIAIWLGHAGVPDRAALTEVTGVLESATKVTRRRSSRYDLSVRSARGEVVRLTLPEREISEDTVRSLLSRPIVALYNNRETDRKDLWELASGNTTIISYQMTRQRHVELQAFETAVGPYVGGGGLLVSLLGVFWLVRRIRATAPA
jgi:hypothetical protein